MTNGSRTGAAAGSIRYFSQIVGEARGLVAFQGGDLVAQRRDGGVVAAHGTAPFRTGAA